ncbi:MAG: hypothetical protein R3C69_11375 [Geminicoccaceae bacterium]
MPVLLTYYTAWVEDGEVLFREDIYDRDDGAGSPRRPLHAASEGGPRMAHTSSGAVSRCSCRQAARAARLPRLRSSWSPSGDLLIWREKRWTKLFEKGLRARKATLGEAYVERNLAAADDFTRPFKRR